ncbi:MAG: zinc ribbon domain-containing protein [Candidatus Sulfotelmatobacter sp.]
MFCLHCGADIPEGSQFCRACGKAQSAASTASGAAAAVAPARTPTPRQPAPPAKSRSNRTVISVIVLAVVVIGGWFAVGHTLIPAPNPQSQPRLYTLNMNDGAFTIAANSFHYVKFTAPATATNVKFGGHFTASGGTGNDVEVWLCTEDAFANWKNGHDAHTLYNSGRVTQDTLNLSLPGAGTYYLVFNNRFSLLTPKAIQANMSMTYYAH